MADPSVVIHPQRREVLALALAIQAASLIYGVWLGLWNKHGHAALAGTIAALFGVSLGLFLIVYVRRAFWNAIEVGESGMTCVRGRNQPRIFEWSEFGSFKRFAHRVRIYGSHGKPILTIDGLKPRDARALVVALQDHGVTEGAAVKRSSGNERD